MAARTIFIPQLALVVLIGASGSGKSTFARRHFKPTEILSSDFCRALASDDENNQTATDDAFEILHFIAARRLRRGLLTVIDATNIAPEDRKPLVKLAREYHVLPVAIVLDMPERVCHERNRARTDRNFGPHVVRRQRAMIRSSLRFLQREGFRHTFTFESPEDLDAAAIERIPLWNDLRHEHGPFDIIGDIHGCHDELVMLLERLGYARTATGDAINAVGGGVYAHPEERKAIFLGDLVDRGPDSPGVLRLVVSMVRAGTALCVPGNHDVKLLRKLRGKNVQITHGLGETLAQLAAEPAEFLQEIAAFIDDLVSHYVLDDGRLVVAHAGMKESMQGRGSGAVREFALYGETTGETDEFGLPVRYNWAAEYRGRAIVVYGHTPVPEPEWLNHTINIDTGCVFGGRLTALRYPERELLSVPALRQYAVPARPFLLQAEPMTAEPVPESPYAAAHAPPDDVLDLDDVIGKRLVETRLHGRVTIREPNAIAALEVMSRFAADPRWLIYLPPTMSPSETTPREGLLEHPAEAFSFFRGRGVGTVVCQEKHMGSRAVAIVCRDEDAARRRFGITDDQQASSAGIIYTRTGRLFFEDRALQLELIHRIRAAAEAAELFEQLRSDWLCLDCELMPWSAKAQALLQSQYAAVGAAAAAALHDGAAVLSAAAQRLEQARPLAERWNARRGLIDQYRDAYRRYCWPIDSVDDLRLAPFHLLASEGKSHVDKDHLWHMPVAHAHAGRYVRGRSAAAARDLSPLCRSERSGERGTRHRLVGGPDPARRRRDGHQAAGVHRPLDSRTGAAGRQVPRPRVPADHLRTGVHSAGAPFAAALARAWAQAVAGAAGVRPRH
jgi:protein phosphatase